MNHDIDCRTQESGFPPVLSVGRYTVAWDDAPGSEGGVDSSHHPEHTQPTEVLPSLVHLEEL